MSCRTHRKRRSNNSQHDNYQDDPHRIHRRSPTTLTRSTMEAVAANEPKARLSWAERAHVAKVILWPYVGDTRAVAVRPRVGERERLAAERLMRREQAAA